MSIDNESAPKWFVEALAAPVETGNVEVDGVSIAYRAWGEEGRPGIVLVHGGMAHSRWWDHVAPQLAEGRRVVALDMSGHGDSGHRDGYSLELWAAEVLAVAQAGGIAGPPVLVGHSMGGIVSFAASHLYGDRLDGVVILDSPIRDLTPEEIEMRAQAARERSGTKVYPTAEEAMARFRLVPPQETAEPYVLEHIARQSMRQVPGGWSWKFDALRMTKDRRTSLESFEAKCRIAYFRSENGIVGPDLLARMRPQFGPDALVTDLPVAGHHPVIDQPLAVVTAVRTVLAAWSPA
ncbi:alpha/beta fold hydrolase [Rhodococcus aetherivorans]|jgi:pimeloyl-ACP methyl ester carboxylesterase|uniref:alpha/beta fold hydrolase n=1 Tax=Rhodococcus TaxID=1827 RepID=UPI00045D3927|nr:MULTISPECIES: alpha/beta hydrolase [Rhodococcus]ANZ23568.1 alpha/beta hydrolase [Rhodococcus sp. WB1]KDE10640.1 alpha/beta hydrolase [Rhodococcus aetherivorans]MBC2589439.1 alpha/beta hydrolase [Rhodococcus aetherivorans]QRI77560.1 alpha/beta hydrolase [Rhodococcus aetherivorans]QSE60979.1 alpha/beta hydrolase [Rhodococcus sp. PSBB066]